MKRHIALTICLVLGLALAWVADRTPRPLPPSAPAQVFSAGRAMIDDRVIARVPHPVGSAANAAARDYLIHRMTALGLAPQVQRTDAFRVHPGDQPLVLGAMVENIVGVLPGRDRAAPAVALMAHYDSVPGSPGAADDAAGVSSALEAVRALKLKGVPARDVMVVITDGEEAGLLGATAFFERHPLAKHVGFVLNMETRGGGGRTQMFQTGAKNAGTVALFQKTASRPAASSLAVFLYEHMPNDTDFTVSKAADVPGLNYAFIGRQFDYHSPTSTSANLDQGSLQHMGDQVLAAATEAAFAPALPAAGPDLVFSQTAGSHLVAYPPGMGWAILAAALGLIAIGALRARRRSALAWADVAKGAGAAVYLIVLSAVLLHLARQATGAAFGFLEQRVLLAQVVRWETALALICIGAVLYAAASLGRGKARFAAALLPLAAGLVCSAFGGWDLVGAGLGAAGGLIALLTFGRPAGLGGGWTGALATGLIVAIAAQVAAPATAFLIAWPLALAALLGAVTAMGTWRPPVLILLVALLAAAGLSWVLVYAHGVFQGLDMAELLALFAWLGALLVWPLAQSAESDRWGRVTALVILLAGFGVTALVRFDPPWNARHPQATAVAYRIDQATGASQRIALTPDLPDWSEAVLFADGGKIDKVEIPVLSRKPVWAAPAFAVAAPGPILGLIRQSDGGLVLNAAPPPGAQVLVLDVRSSATLTGVTINGRPAAILAKPSQWTRLRWQAAPQGLALGFRAPGPGTLETRYASITEAWPAKARPLPARPVKVMAFDVSDSTIVTGARRFTW
jgi:hypothetical protein